MPLEAAQLRGLEACAGDAARVVAALLMPCWRPTLGRALERVRSWGGRQNGPEVRKVGQVCDHDWRPHGLRRNMACGDQVALGYPTSGDSTAATLGRGGRRPLCVPRATSLAVTTPSMPLTAADPLPSAIA